METLVIKKQSDEVQAICRRPHERLIETALQEDHFLDLNDGTKSEGGHRFIYSFKTL